MNNEYAVEIVIGFIAVPWFAWATAQIFSLKQEQAVSREVLISVRDWIKSQEKH